MPYTHLSDQDELNMITDHFTNRLSYNKLQKKYHCSGQRINKIFAKYGLKVEKNIHNGKYRFNRDFFFQENEDLAYFLGWICSDGFIQEKTNVIAIEIKQSDKKVLEDIRQAMQYDRPILDIERPSRGQGFFSKFILENKEVKSLLVNKYNIIPNKSSDTTFCFNFANLNKQFWKDFIRGYFDGDGSIKMTGQSLTFQIDSTSLKMLLAIECAINALDSTIKLSICKRDCESRSKVINGHAFTSKLPMFRLYGYGDNAQKVFDLLYNDANIYLQRKYDRYIQYMK